MIKKKDTKKRIQKKTCLFQKLFLNFRISKKSF